ncbi:unnamed protein product [Cyclocybe aegerita]|uniref:Uncharacterized protein n=1 Tax=Cyclocybe aegerita TaxID=1973307 RepID=A0A8S0WX27_CYCAE|nr:unnamed protein product [Cyclocybe aegerita]
MLQIVLRPSLLTPFCHHHLCKPSSLPASILHYEHTLRSHVQELVMAAVAGAQASQPAIVTCKQGDYADAQQLYPEALRTQERDALDSMALACSHCRLGRSYLGMAGRLDNTHSYLDVAYGIYQAHTPREEIYGVPR